MANELGKSSFSEYIIVQSDAQEMSESRFNLLIGAMLSWGFFINCLLIRYLTPTLLRWVYGSRGSNPLIVLLVGYFALALTGSALLRRRNTTLAFIGYNLIALPVGIVLALVLWSYDAAIVQQAMLSTAAITFIMMVAATLRPAFFERIGSALGIALLATIVVELAASLIFRMHPGIIDWVVVVIMALYVGFDWARANSVQRTPYNAIAASSALYLDIINIFLRLLRILSRSRRN
ncbi:MAG: US12 family protein [Clostridia bacterium]|nr:US12 family protein [Clostridia bacterium]